MHENEIRVLADASSEGSSKIDHRRAGDLYNIPIDVNQFIDEVCIDPRLPEDDLKNISNEIKELGYNGPIRQSELYKIKKMEIRMF